MVLDNPLLSRLSHKRLMATFQVEAQRGEQDLYRCITLSFRGAAISNFGELIVRGKLGGSVGLVAIKMCFITFYLFIYLLFISVTFA